MVYVFSLLYFLIAYWGYRKYRFILNPITSMFGLWAIIIPFSDRGFYNTIIPTDRVYFIILIGLIGFLFGTLLGSKNIRFVFGNIGREKSGYRQSYRINYMIVYILCAIAIVYYLLQFAIVIRLLISGYGYDYIRKLAVSKEDTILHTSYFMVLIKSFIAVPITYLTIALFPIELFYGKRKKILVIEAVVLMILFTLTSGGRSVILWIALYFVCVLLIKLKQSTNSEFHISTNVKIAIVICLIALFSFMYLMTKSRKGSDVDFMRQFFIYFVAPLPHFDHYIDVVDRSKMVGYGISSFYGLLYPLFFFLRLIGVFKEYPPYISEIYRMSFEMMETGTNIGSNIYMNAFVTAFYQPYLDGRLVGVFIILFVFGYVSNLYFVRAYYEEDVKALLIYVLLLQKILFSFVRFYFTQQSQALCFILAFFVMKRVGSAAETDI